MLLSDNLPEAWTDLREATDALGLDECMLMEFMESVVAEGGASPVRRRRWTAVRQRGGPEYPGLFAAAMEALEEAGWKREGLDRTTITATFTRGKATLALSLQTMLRHESAIRRGTTAFPTAIALVLSAPSPVAVEQALRQAPDLEVLAAGIAGAELKPVATHQEYVLDLEAYDRYWGPVVELEVEGKYDRAAALKRLSAQKFRETDAGSLEYDDHFLLEQRDENLAVELAPKKLLVRRGPAEVMPA